ncbi:MAG: M56 family metallopeptidase [Planctomycetaceae bacterium]
MQNVVSTLDISSPQAASGITNGPEFSESPLEPEPDGVIALPTPEREQDAVVAAPFGFPTDSGQLAPKLSWRASLLLAYAVGTLVVLLVIARQLMQLRHLVRGSNHACDRAFAALVKLQSRLKMRRSVRLLVTSEADSPIAFGTVRPTIILPTDEYTPAELRTVLGHELAHLRRWDGWVGWLQLAMMTAWWFHPVFWVLNRTIRRVREDCCDDLLIGTGLATTDEYCDTLLRVAALPSTAPVHVACSMSGRLHPLGSRIKRIMDTRVRRTVRLSVLNLAAIAIVAGILLPGLRSELSQAQESNSATTASVEENFEIPADLPVASKKIDRFDSYGGYSVDFQPLVVDGQCVNTEGKPVANATLRLFIPGLGMRYYNEKGERTPLEPLVATVKSDANGRFTIKADRFPIKEFKPEPVAKPRESSFLVIGTAEGKGLSSSGEKTLRLTKRPESLDPREKQTLFFEDEPIELKLIFRPEVRIHGVVKDDLGQPLEGATVQLGVVQNGRDLWATKPRMLAYTLRDVEESTEHGPGWQLRDMPEKYRIATTNERGEYEIRGLPANTRTQTAAMITPDFQRYQETIISSDGEGRFQKYVGSDGQHDIVLIRPRAVSIKVKGPSNPRCQVRVEQLDARKPRYLGPGSIAVTKTGVARLAIPPGKYRLLIEPFAGQKLLPTQHELVVSKELRQSSEFELEPAASIAIRAVIQGANDGIEGITFLHKLPGQEAYEELQSQPGFVDHPRTDGTGVLRATVPAGTNLLRVGSIPPGFEKLNDDVITVNVEPGDQKVIRVAFRKRDEAVPEVNETFADLAEKLDRQTRLLSRGRFLFRRNSFLQGDLLAIEMQQVLEALEGKSPKHAEAILKHVFPAAGFSATQTMLVDHHRMAKANASGKGVFRWQGMMVTDIDMNNGTEQLRYSARNSQLDVANARNSSVYIGAFRDLVEIPNVNRFPPDVKRSVDGDKTRYTIEAEGVSATLVVDTDSGFVYELSQMRGGSGRLTRQYQPVKDASGAMTPRLKVTAQFRAGKLDRADVTFLDQADLVTAFPPGTFSLALPAGTNVIDSRDRDRSQVGSRPNTAILSAPVTDIVAFANARRSRRLAAQKQHPAKPKLKIGSKAPAFDVVGWYDQNGKTHGPNLEAKVVLLNFHRVSRNQFSGHIDEIQKLREAHEVLKKRGVEIVNVYPHNTDPKKASEFMKQYKLPWKFAIDKPPKESRRPGKTFAAFGFTYSTTTVIIDASGTIYRSISHNDQTRDAIRSAMRMTKEP